MTAAGRGRSGTTGAAGPLRVHTSERADVLVDALGDLLTHLPAGTDPFAREVVAVPTRGVERWVAQRLSHRLGAGPDGEAGVSARIDFDPPARLVARAVADATGTSRDDDPWEPERLVWHVLRAVDDAVAQAMTWAGPLARHLTDEPGARDDVRAGRRLRLARRLAGAFAAYAAQRPSLVVAWAAGRDDDGAGAPLPADVADRKRLWRAVRAAAATPSPAELLADAVAALRTDPDRVDLPSRLSVLGPTRLPRAHVDVLTALAVHRDVHLWLPHPSAALWQRAQRHATTDAAGVAPRRRAVPTIAVHPLLASAARDATELGLRLAAVGADVTHHPAPAPAATVLGALQAALRADERPGRRPGGGPGERRAPGHPGHGRGRQVEVLREAVLGVLADDPTLQPRDVVVLCPDVEAFAPLVVAAFGGAATPGEPDDAGAPGGARPAVHPGRTLRVRVADRAPARTNPLLRVLAELLALAGSRVTASGVVDLAGLPAVRRRFGFDDADLERVRGWALESGVRWGEDQVRRARYGLGAVAQGTWRTATDRLLLGVAMAEEDHRFVGSALPLDDVDSTAVDLAGRFAELVERLTALLDELEGVRPASAWFDALDRALLLLTAADPADAWQEVGARAVLTEARTSAAGADVPLRLPDVVALLDPYLAGRPTRTGFRTGALTVCSLEPMRAVPHRVVCLLGLDDGVFPRAGAPDGDDVLARDPLVGERDRRAEDRQLFLDAVTAAGDHLLIVHSGADERTGAPRPPAVPVGELLDAVDEAVELPGGRPAREALVVHHPLQTVDERNFVPGALGRPGPFSFDDVDRAAAVVARSPRRPRPPLLGAPLPPLDEPVLDLDDLVAALEHPVKAFVRRRLGVLVPGEVEDLDDRLPLTLAPLDGWATGDRLLAAVLDGVDLDRAAAAERRRGKVPPGNLGGAALGDVATRVAAVAAAAVPVLGAPATTVDVTVPLPGGRVLTGTVPGVHGDVLVRAVYARLGAKHRLRAWVRLLALVAGPEAPPVRGAATVGRGPGTRATAATSWLTPPSPDDARRLLADLVAVRDRAMCAPLPLPVAAAGTYAQRRHGHDDPAGALADAQQVLRDRFEHTDEYHVLAWGDGFTLTGVAGDPTPADRAAWPDEPTLLGALARTVWDALLTHEGRGPA
ncbi:exodeoxyribonuclease V subunit gamma [Cellulomonas wangsupingiae]|uniref:exodeoxyribonuclease V subunit gamma n=1 Tax=Cellulomonas wangsupingiae TaxID=2968085 RepID=UPI00202F1FD8|nr:exodeoxyribonuclease V subunit gamma [Cellulomonas wangsupingiae]MCM0641139.1 exodeoxyribonuclease V subunit gamma [Cellulomonas wangsupingiae]